mmetsp:Transcript_6671/g.11131  ORF Transcript_6671/g.11131 Transcript_6671/m.11131 type:complete len:265 (-) Transcript_6671:424-1218(-)|eukprot:CAMPEP_0181040394 /NCGR_PEP_ID=MMETSP1070-20121207/11024_1 /TAXON_ID=265543 /ORGANISM="Minutocellus polymorphus, Strain NH13" /LENGTH=264 /DNA_ID=CAMNT_0023118399 /DNA_START=142 /DNA_END=936 /DNA_ORIENTATION=-
MNRIAGIAAASLRRSAATKCTAPSSASSSASLSLSVRSASVASTTTRSYSATASSSSPEWHGTTILCVRKDGKVCMMGDGQVSMGPVVVKPNAKKIRRILPKTSAANRPAGEEGDKDEKGGTIVGFAGSTADAFTLLERLEGKLDEHPGQLARSCVELAKGWRTDKYLRRLEASLLVADETVSLEITGNGDVLESHDGVLGVGSGSNYAIAAARALVDVEGMSAEDVCRKAMTIASDMCVYTNSNYMVEVMDTADGEKKEEDDE